MEHCSLDYAVKRLSNACNGIKSNDHRQYWGYIGKWTVSFLADGNRACCFGVRKTGEKDDWQSDYCADSFFSNITRAIGFAQRNI